MATLSAAAERNEDVLYICYDNEIYGNTGGQRSSSTPLGAATTTTPTGKDIAKKDILAVMAAHRIPYTASLSMAHPEDARRKLELALATRGFRFLHVFSPCPTGWKSEPGVGIELVRKAVRTGLFPVVEVEHGRRWTINIEPEPLEQSEATLEAYFAAQGRFKGGVDLAAVRTGIDETWTDLRARAAARRP
jgi:pyruvate ferredoxin oxidoreductase beta subunit/2-oxoisovalerate ferredoxin oxidoreductase beta subunit